jgi:hypothetical protein
MTSVADVTFALLREAWSALGGGTDLLALVDLTGDGAGLLPSTLPALPAMVAAVSVSTLAASVLEAARRARPPASILIDAEHVAVAAATLTDPDAHASAQYAPTGAEAMTVNDAAHVITTITGQPVKHQDIDRETWVQSSIAAGVPADYTDMLRLLTETIGAGHGSRPNNDVESVTGAPPTSFADFVRRSTNHWIGH